MSEIVYEKYKNGDDMTLYITNEIKQSDLMVFKNIVSDLKLNNLKLHMDVVRLNSQGGDGHAAREIGRLIRKNKLNTYIAPSHICRSACVYILFGGVMRYAFGEIGVHRTTFFDTPKDDDFIDYVVDKDIKRVRSYVEEMRLSSNISDAILSTPSWKYRKLSDDEKTTWELIGVDRYHEELFFNKMSRERSITRDKVSKIHESNYDYCLTQARDLTESIFDCSFRKSEEITNTIKTIDITSN